MKATSSDLLMLMRNVNDRGQLIELRSHFQPTFQSVIRVR
jgi:hypothetical protein